MVKKTDIANACFVVAIMLSAISCTTDDVQVANHVKPYFSLEDYFQQEASRLQQLAPSISKMVSKNGETESHDIQIDNWESELALFIDSDINKAAWQSSYKIDSTMTSLVYTSLDPELRTEQITVEKGDDGTIKHIGVSNRIKNMLYQTDEQLDYYPDSLYRITKQQHVRIIGESNYLVAGTFQQ
ncbi:hypothetical protein [Parapedobacter tibetensis]|uniref:hypothetical protein n=1 Tax=Parapedobacter tibetensis TaxID=2972951 RepID=UPI00214DCD4F|nr:hypothetical protein [Parapedobacter tibetensis]